VRVPESVQINPGLVQRIDLMAVASPRSVRRSFWFLGLLAIWTLIGAVSSLAMEHWAIAAITSATAALSGFIGWVLRRSMRRIPQTSQWLEGLSNS
jgi:hypothetical protein